ncbi:hypothetical protein BDZ85DRAFT_270659 [Elsinoe ampelina]|uniref:Uncharacterized protein n=1 Tax=Elsinoe ampelina TaxID=302913 RepID=A0A6A6FY30_9PEZI|nr:hypothetical protein BDZ85DRAFT_270659 [Elsinoe ampelina]
MLSRLRCEVWRRVIDHSRRPQTLKPYSSSLFSSVLRDILCPSITTFVLICLPQAFRSRSHRHTQSPASSPRSRHFPGTL